MTDITILNDFAVPTDDHARDTFVYRVQTEEVPLPSTEWCRTEKSALRLARLVGDNHDQDVSVQKFTFKLSKKGVLDLLNHGGA